MTPSLHTIHLGTDRNIDAGSAALRGLGITLGLATVLTVVMNRRSGKRSPEQLPVESPHFDRFLRQATTAEDQPDSALGRDCLFGLYTSWCLLNQAEPRSELAFWVAMRRRGIHPGHTRLRMTGPAAADYILASAPALVSR